MWQFRKRISIFDYFYYFCYTIAVPLIGSEMLVSATEDDRIGNDVMGLDHASTAVVAQRLIPHLLAPLLSIRYPFCPHFGPQLFLISQ